MRSFGLMIALVGCTAKDGDEIPQWDDGIPRQGDCPTDVVATDAVGSSLTVYNDFYPLVFTNLPDPVGTIAENESTYTRVMNDLSFAPPFPTIDFSRNLVAFVWADAERDCGLTHLETHTKTTSGGKNIVEVTLESTPLVCTGTTDFSCDDSYLVIQQISNDAPAGVCLRIVPGCGS